MNQNEELMHYGVLGMKCGVLRGNVSGSYSKAVNKQNKLNKNVVKAKKAYDKTNVKAKTGASAKYQKLQAKADSKKYKYEKAYAKKLKKANPLIRTSISDALYTKSVRLSDKAESKYKKAQMKADKYKSKYDKDQIKNASAEAKYIKAQRKAEKWTKAMEKTFKGIDINSLSEESVSNGRDYIKKIS